MNAKTNLKQKIRTLTETKRTLWAEIRKLKEEGSKTGEQRSRIKQGYDWSTRPVARTTHLAYGLVRGRRYAQIEQKCNEAPDPYLILKAIHEADEHLKEVYSLEDVRTWLDPVTAVVENWKKVDKLCAEGKGDTEEADKLREEIEWPWNKLMTSEDMVKANAIIRKLTEKRDGVAA